MAIPGLPCPYFSRGIVIFFRLLYVAVKLNTIETYALMARCLKGEATPKDEKRLADLFQTHANLRKEYDHFRLLFPDLYNDAPVNGISNEQDLQKKLERITRRLKQDSV